MNSNRLSDGRQTRVNLVVFSEKQIKINHRGLGKYYFIIDNLQNVEKVKSYFGDEIIIKVKFTTNTYEEKKTTE